MATLPQATTTLEPDACWALLRRADVGRLAVTVDGRPDIFPVNYAVDRGTVVFRTAPGTKLVALMASPEVAFEVDGHDEVPDEAWSVVVRGSAEVVRGFEQMLDVGYLPVYPWQAARKGHFVRILVEEVTGRRFRRVDRSFWDTPGSGVPPQHRP